MTTTAPPAAPERRGRRRRGRVGLAAALVLLVVLVAALGSWPLATGYARARITATGDTVECRGAAVDGRTVTYTRGMRCVLRMTIRNDGPWSVSLRRLLLDVGGPGTDGPVRALEASPAGREVDYPDREDALKAAFGVRGKVPPGESRVVEVVVKDALRVCNSAGTFILPWPAVGVSVLGRRGTVQVPGAWRVHLAGPVRASGEVCPKDL